MKPLDETKRAGDDMQIILGDGWQRFAFPTPGFVYLGTVRRGMQIGALALDQTGGYLQVNGDIHQPLNRSRVAARLRRGGVRPESMAEQTKAEAERRTVTVIVKRRRRILTP